MITGSVVEMDVVSDVQSAKCCLMVLRRASRDLSNDMSRHIDEMFGGSVLQIWSDLEGASSASGARSTSGTSGTSSACSVSRASSTSDTHSASSSAGGTSACSTGCTSSTGGTSRTASAKSKPKGYLESCFCQICVHRG